MISHRIEYSRSRFASRGTFFPEKNGRSFSEAFSKRQVGRDPEIVVAALSTQESIHSTFVVVQDTDDLSPIGVGALQLLP